jgi:hypothetical protein
VASDNWGTEEELDPELVQLDREADRLVFHFPTEWTAPLPLVATVASRFPTLEFSIVYGDEAMSYAGVASFANGAADYYEEYYCDRAAALALLQRWWPEEAEMWTFDRDLEDDDVQTRDELEDATETLGCSFCGSSAIYETRTVRQLVLATQTRDGFTTSPTAAASVTHLDYECGACSRPLDHHTLAIQDLETAER